MARPIAAGAEKEGTPAGRGGSYIIYIRKRSRRTGSAGEAEASGLGQINGRGAFYPASTPDNLTEGARGGRRREEAGSDSGICSITYAVFGEFRKIIYKLRA